MSDDVTPSEGTPTPPAKPVTPPTPPATPTTPPLTLDDIPQELRNQIESNHRRGLQQKIETLTEQNTALGQLREQSAAFMDLASANGIQFDGDNSQLGDVATQVMGTLEGLQTEQERLTKANAKKAEEIDAAAKRADVLQTELFDTLIMNQLFAQLGALDDDGRPRCVSPKAAEMVAKELKSLAKVGDDRTITFEMDVVDAESGMSQKKPVDAKTAVGALEADAAWKTFFTATVNSGAGGDVVDGVQRNAGNGEVDINALAGSEDGIRKFFEIMEKQPELIDRAMEKIPR